MVHSLLGAETSHLGRPTVPVDKGRAGQGWSGLTVRHTAHYGLAKFILSHVLSMKKGLIMFWG